MQEENVKKSFFIFNFNTVLILILLAGVVALYILWYGNRCKTDQDTAVPYQPGIEKGTSIVFVNLDTLNAHYEFVKVLRTDIEATGRRLHADILAEQNAFEKEAADFQRQINANAITEERAKVVYEQLMQKQQAILDKKDRYTQQVADQELNMNLRLVDTVINFLKRYNQNYRYDYILGYKTGGEILLGNDTLEITASVLESLNKEYQEKKK